MMATCKKHIPVRTLVTVDRAVSMGIDHIVPFLDIHALANREDMVGPCVNGHHPDVIFSSHASKSSGLDISVLKVVHRCGCSPVRARSKLRMMSDNASTLVTNGFRSSIDSCFMVVSLLDRVIFCDASKILLRRETTAKQPGMHRGESP